MSIQMKNGRIPLNTVNMDTPDEVEIAKTFTPMGGVIWPASNDPFEPVCPQCPPCHFSLAAQQSLIDLKIVSAKNIDLLHVRPGSIPSCLACYGFPPLSYGSLPFHGFGWAAPPCGPASCFSSSIEEER